MDSHRDMVSAVGEEHVEPHIAAAGSRGYRVNVRTLIRRRRPRARAETATPLPLPLGLLVDALSPREAHGCWRTPPPPWPPPPHACSTTTVAPAPRADATLADLTPPPPPPQPPLRGARCGFSAEATPVEATPVEAPPLTPESCDRRRLVAIPVACPLHCARRRRWSRRAVRRCPAS